jgi:hypothetical protein
MFENAVSQISFNNIDSTCSCLQYLLKTQNSKIDFSIGLENCISISFQEALKFKSPQMVDKYLIDIENQLKSDCQAYIQCQKILYQMSLQKTESKIIDFDNCKIMRTGDFEDNSGSERSIVSMMDSIQIVKFEKTGYYTKSKVIWKDDCSFNLVFVSSTNPYEKLMTKYSDTREIRIIEISEGQKIILEIEFSGLYFIKELTKLKTL